MNRLDALRRYARQCRPRLPRFPEPLLVGQVFARLDARLVDHLQFVVGQLAHRRSLLAPAVGDLLTISSYGW